MKVRVLCVVLAAALLGACAAGASSQPARTAAADQLKKSLAAKNDTVVWKLREGRVCVFEESGFDDGASRELLDTAEVLERRGLATVRRLQPSDWGDDLAFFRAGRQCPVFGAYWVSVELTEKGRQAAQAWQRTGNEYQVVVATMGNVTVTGITGDGASMARVEYTVAYDPTPVGQAVGFASRQVLASAAVFRRYDDGWRLVDDGRDQLEPAGR